MNESMPNIEVAIVGKVSFDLRLGLLSLDIETAPREGDGLYSCLSWAFTREDEEFDQIWELLDPPPLD